MNEGVLVAARFALMVDLALLMGLPLFWWTMGGQAHRGALAALAAGGLLLSMLWLFASAATMTGTPITAPDWATARILLTMTPIGPVLAVRAAALFAVLIATLAPPGGRVTAVPAAIAAATLAWTGHGGATEGMTGTVHRIADVAHIWAAAGWVGALVALLHAVAGAVVAIERITAMLARFSVIGTLFVATLIVTGTVNGLMIVGAAQLPALTGSRYGLLLGAKLLLFGGMLALAAVNRWRLTPALERGQATVSAVRHLRLSLLTETGAAVLILMLVAWLGTLDPLA